MVRPNVFVFSYALPFFAFIMSAISRFNARFGSKFWGSHAFTGVAISSPPSPATLLLLAHTDVSLQRRLHRFSPTAEAVPGRHSGGSCFHRQGKASGIRFWSRIYGRGLEPFKAYARGESQVSRINCSLRKWYTWSCDR
jgi:hypothetical protein